MEQRIKDRYNDGILQAAMQRYGIDSDGIRMLDSYESFIYEYELKSENYILRIGHTFHRSEALIQGEVDWINYLAAGGVSVARAVYSESGKLVEMIDDGQGGNFLVTAFVRARGTSPWKVGWTPELYQKYGSFMGNMHALSVGYQHTFPAFKRPAWDDDLFEFVERYLPSSEVMAKEKYRYLRAQLQTLPVEGTSYGMIHQDAHGSNFFVDDTGRITMFDFDECAYSWFINDIAIALFYIVMDADDWSAFTSEFMAHFLRGYRQAYPLDPKWLMEIPNFLKLREIELYAVMHRDHDVNNISYWWDARFMKDRKYKIENDVPFIDFDFESLSVYL
jgi:amicoumacin kinase